MGLEPDIRADWVAALRSGRYRKANGHLRDGDAFCALGVLVDIHPDLQWTLDEGYDGEVWMALDKTHADDNNCVHSVNGLPVNALGSAGLPEAFLADRGLPYDADEAVSTANDLIHGPHGPGVYLGDGVDIHTFADIADLIEQNGWLQ